MLMRKEYCEALKNYSQTERDHGEILDDLEEFWEDRPGIETYREVDYYKIQDKKIPDEAGEIDLMVCEDDCTIFYEVKSNCSYGDMSRAMEQLERAYEAFDGQTENVLYVALLDEREVEYEE